ncbi:hypothetical protein [Lewinella sp. W8]|uniref:hypothetical protein n=1 Tax=Lewinella sp. W8 TaxID=2528208 RepID=UPI001067D21E|nr:hypothetical protein [Lewinella sp. W8]MTB52429.1 hypothetical protein [Lewinella sp. W8]
MQARHYSQLYRRLRDVDPRDYQRIIRMYEEKETEIGRLDVVEHFELTTYYVDALFHTGAYRQHQMMVDLVIQASIAHNIRRVPGIEPDVFHHLLFRKAASAYRLQDYDTAIYVAQELIRMCPEEEIYVRFLRAALFKEQKSTLQFGRASFIFCMLMTALVITLDLLVVKHFYPAGTEAMQWLTIDLWVIGLLLLVGSYGYAYFRAERYAHQFQRSQPNK